jgi:hypothetical protein
MEAPRVKEVMRLGTWEERVPGLLWICEPSGGEDFYFSLEGWRLDRLTDEQFC